MKILNNPSKKKIINQLGLQFGIEKFPYLFLQFGKDKYRIFSGSLSREDIGLLDRSLNIETAGLYFAKQQADGIRLTLDSLSLLRPQIKKNLFSLDKDQAEKWFHGEDLQIAIDNNFKILEFEGDLIGCGKSTGERITNGLPKERRIRS